jgi:hypothetical protein
MVDDGRYWLLVVRCWLSGFRVQLWLELLRDDCAIPLKVIEPIWQEADELVSIFVTMAKNAKAR